MSLAAGLIKIRIDCMPRARYLALFLAPPQPMRIVDREQATKDRKRIVSKAKDDAGDSADWWRGRPRGFDALGLSDSGRARYGGTFCAPVGPTTLLIAGKVVYRWRSKGLWRAFYSGNLPATEKGVISLLAVWQRVASRFEAVL